MIMTISTNIKLLPKREIKLGDEIAKIAEPIKEFLIDHSPKVIAEYLKNCNCEKRREFLNKHFTINNK